MVDQNLFSNQQRVEMQAEGLIIKKRDWLFKPEQLIVLT